MTTDEFRAALLALRDVGEQFGASSVSLEASGESIEYRIGHGAVLRVGGDSVSVPEAWVDRVDLAPAQEQGPA